MLKILKTDKRFYLNWNALNKFLANPEFEFISDLEQNETLIWDDIWSQGFLDFMIDNIINEEEKIYNF